KKRELNNGTYTSANLYARMTALSEARSSIYSVSSALRRNVNNPHRLVRGFRGHVNQNGQPCVAAVLNAVFLAGLRQSDFTLAKLPLFFADLKHSPALDHVIDFIGALMRVRRLLLPRLEAVNVAKKSFGLEDAVLFHFVGGELNRVGNFFEAAHETLLGRFRPILSHGPGMQKQR